MDCAIPPQKTHSIAFEPRRLCYPWHPWYDRNILTRPAGGAHAAVAYFCKLPETPHDAMLVEVPRWMFDAVQCATMRAAEFAHVDCATLHTLRRAIAEQRASMKPAVIQPQLSRQAGDGDIDGNDSNRTSNDATGDVRRTPRRTAVGRSRSVDTRRDSQTSGATTPQHSSGQSKPRRSRARSVR